MAALRIASVLTGVAFSLPKILVGAFSSRKSREAVEVYRSVWIIEARIATIPVITTHRTTSRRWRRRIISVCSSKPCNSLALYFTFSFVSLK